MACHVVGKYGALSYRFLDHRLQLGGFLVIEVTLHVLVKRAAPALLILIVLLILRNQYLQHLKQRHVSEPLVNQQVISRALNELERGVKRLDQCVNHVVRSTWHVAWVFLCQCLVLGAVVQQLVAVLMQHQIP